MPKPPLNHMMLNDDTLADEFEAILGLRTSHEGLVLSGSYTNNVLILDPNSVALSSADKSYEVADAFFQRIGATVTHATTGNITAGQLATDWDLIVVPAIRDVDGNYTGLATSIGLITGTTTCPIYVMAAIDPADAARQAVTGCTADTAISGATMLCTTLNIESRTLTRMSFFGQAATTLSGSASVIASDGTNHVAWRFDIGSHPTMWVAGFTSSADPTSMNFKPWLGAQWMCDHQPDAGRTASVKAGITKAALLFRYDGFDNNDTVTSYGTADPGDPLPTLYSKLVAHGWNDLILAAVGQGDTDPGATNGTVAAWWAARDRSQGGIVRAHNHHTDLVDNTGSTGPACTTDGVTLDNEAAAATEYNRICDLLTADGMTLGTDGYGAGEICVQNGNDMNAPTAQFMAARGIYLSLAREQYPNGTVGPPVASFFPYAQADHSYEGAKYTYWETVDGVTETANNISLTHNQKVIRCLILGGGLYVHGGANLTGPLTWIEEVLELPVACPDVITTSWADLKAWLDAGTDQIIFDEA